MPKFSMDRRQFALGAAAAVTALVLPEKALSITVVPDDLLSQSAAAPTSDAQALDAKIQAAMAKLTPAAQAEVEMKVASIIRKYGDKLSEEQKADIHRIMAESQEGLEKMRTFKLDNGDQPADTFSAAPDEAKLHKDMGGKK
ncbi:MAG TPA: hypothetical protein VHA06_19255 [Candidatus Angelobacter sp.]|nr:hypothetical protein [Candidatus Angelobacter sp.]